jgi:hypothetical protein
VVTYESAIARGGSHAPKRQRNSLSLLCGVLQLLTDDELRAVRAEVDNELWERTGNGVSLTPGRRAPLVPEGTTARA